MCRLIKEYEFFDYANIISKLYWFFSESMLTPNYTNIENFEFQQTIENSRILISI